VARLKQLGDLAGLRKDLDVTARARRESDEAARHARHAALAQADEFRAAVGGVQPLKHAPRHHAPAPAIPPLPLQRQADDQAVLDASVSDIDAETLLDTDENLSWRRPGTGTDVLRRLRRGDWAIQSELDLHGLRVDEARPTIAAFLREAARQGVRCVRLVHGKGLGSRGGVPVLKGRVRAWLLRRDDVIAFCQARPAHGGAGALLVLLRPAPATGR